MTYRSIFLALGAFLITSTLQAQTTHFTPDNSWRAYNGVVTPPLCQDKLCHYYPTNSFESAYKEFAAWRSTDETANNAESFMNFRVAFPLNYNKNRATPYPVIIMLHGAGESGRIWSGNFDYLTTDPRYDNNSRNLLHGGNVHQQAANRVDTHPQSFPGIIIFPQASYSGSWASGWQDAPTLNQEYIYAFLEYMVKDYNADINRISIHGLSNGARGTWDTATKRPDLFAAVLPMSGVPYNSEIAADRLETTPIRLYQGGTDTNPSPGGSMSMIDKLVAKGGNPQYILYPTLGHGVWNQAYSEPDFWSWMLAKDKRNIYIFGGSTELCIGSTKKLGISYGYTSYQWKKDGVDILGETTRYLTITGDIGGNYIGSYTVDFVRPNGTSGTSNPVVITGPGAPITPALTVTGSLILPYTRDDNSIIGSIGQVETRLYAPTGYTQYEWYRGGVLQGTTSANNAKITHGGGSGSGSSNFNNVDNQNNAGNWTVRVLQPSGCWSNHSNIKTLVYNINPHTLPTGGSVNENGSANPPLRYMANLGKPALEAQSATQMLVTWTETVPDEEFFEIWRQNAASTNNWNMIATVPAGSTQFLDNGLNPGTGYAYLIRAMVATSGRYSRKSASSTNNFTSTLPDTQAPTPPSNVLVTDITETSISISWSPSTDNHLVAGYEVFSGSDFFDIVNSPSTTYTFEGLDAGTTYILNVRATDFTGNYSTFPQAVVATTLSLTNGVAYNYFFRNPMPGANGNRLANFDFTQTPNNTGFATNFNDVVSIAGTIQGNGDPSNFFLDYTAYLNIMNAGNYRFYTNSDDGSRLYIDDVLIINSDFDQGTTLRNGVVSTLSVGLHKIRVQYYEVNGGNVLTVGFNYSTQTSILTWNNSTTYSANDIAVRNGTYYRSLRNNNLNQQPPNTNYWVSLGSTQPTLPVTSTSIITSIPTWVNNIGYAVGDIVLRNGTYYTAIQGGIGNTPPNATFWTSLGSTAPTFHPTNNGSAIIIPTEYLFRIGTPTLTNYYYVPSINDLTNTNNWWSNSNGTGSHPPNFTNAQQVFNIQQSHSLDNPWLVSGNYSRVILTNSATLTLNNTLTGRLSANTGTTINLNTPNAPTFSELNSTSTVNMNVSGTVPLAVYGNLNLTTGATTLPISSTLVNGNMQVSNAVTLNGSAFPDHSTLLVGGNITFLGNSNPPALANQYSLIFDGNNAHTMSVNQTDISLAALEVEGTLNLNFNDASTHTLNVGVTNGSGGLLLRSGSTLNLANHNLVVNGVYGVNPTDDSGEININGGNITVATASGQTSSLYFSDEVNTHNVQNLTLSNTGAGQINLAGQTKLTNLMTVSAGTVNMQGDFVLRSTSDAANGTARIGPLLGGAKIKGNVIAQRYMSGEGRIYRYISSPVKGATAQQLQASFPITGNFDGASSGPGLNSANASMFQYNETTNPQYQQFPAVGTSNLDTLRRGKGYSLFIRNDTTGTVWQVTGEPYQGTIPFVLTGGTGSVLDGWNLLGNPYAAPIKWTGNSTGGWSMSGVSSTAYIRENFGTTTLVKSHNGSTGSNGWDGIIAPGQAFWVRTIIANPTLSVSENAKQITDGAFYRENGNIDNTLEIVMSNATAQDAAVIQLIDGATAAFDTQIDGVKQNNSFFNLSTLSSDGKPLVFNLTTPNYCNQEIQLRIEKAAVGTYDLAINGLENIISGDQITLIDSFMQTEKVIGESENLTFTITSDAASKADGRFTLRFEKPEVTLNQMLKAYPACEEDSPIILVTNSQPGVTYQAFHNGMPVTEAFTSLGGTLEIPGDKDKLGFGTTEVTIKAGFKGCDTFELPMSINVQRDSLATPEIIVKPNRLIASTTDAQYKWYLNGVELPKQTNRELLAPENGIYEVEVTLSTCVKKSAAREYSVTGIEDPTQLHQLYPNPTHDKVLVTLEEPIDFASVRVVSMIGQVLQVPVTKISDHSAEVDLTDEQAGLYLLQVNGQRYKVLKK